MTLTRFRIVLPDNTPRLPLDVLGSSPGAVDVLVREILQLRHVLSDEFPVLVILLAESDGRIHAATSRIIRCGVKFNVKGRERVSTKFTNPIATTADR